MKQTEFQKDKDSILSLLKSNDVQQHEIVRLYIPRCPAKIAAIEEMCDPFKFDCVVYCNGFRGENIKLAYLHFKSLRESSDYYIARWLIPDTNELFTFEIDSRSTMKSGLISFYASKIGDRDSEIAKKYAIIVSGYNLYLSNINHKGAGLLFESFSYDAKGLKQIQAIFKSKRWRRIVELVSRKLRRYYYTLF